MSGNSDTTVSRHTKNHVAKIGLSGQNLATFRHVADITSQARDRMHRLQETCIPAVLGHISLEVAVNICKCVTYDIYGEVHG